MRYVFMKLLKANFPFILLFIVGAFILLTKNQELSETVAPYSDTTVTFSAGHSLSQTWSPHTKKITGVSLPYTAEEDFSSGFSLAIIPVGPESPQDAVVTCSIESRDFQKNESGTLTFNFDTIFLQPGKQYQFLFTYTNSDFSGTLTIPSNSEYSGCFVDGSSTASGLSIDISFVKNNHFYLLFIIFVPLMSFSLFFMLLFRKKWEEVIALSVVLMTAILYIAGLAEHLETGINIIYVLTILALVFSICLFNLKKQVWRNLLSPGLFIFAVLMVIILFYNINMRRALWDEFSHWGLAVKDMFYFNSFAKHTDTTVMLPWYPPFITLFQYYVQYQNGLFSENLLYIAFQIVMCSFLLPCLKNIHLKNIRLLPHGLLILLCIPIIFFPEVFNSIRVDSLLAVILAYTIFCYYSHPLSIFNFLRIAAGLFALVLTKEMGAPIAGLATIIFILDNIYQKKRFSLHSLFPFLGLTLFVITVFCSWRIYLFIPVTQPSTEVSSSSEISEEVCVQEKHLQTDEVSAEDLPNEVTAIPTSTSGFTLQNFIELLSGNAPGWRYKTITNYIYTLFSDPTYSLGVINVSILDVCFLLLIIAFLLSRCTEYRDDKNILSIALFGTLCGLPYLAFLLICYLFAFSPIEAEILHSFHRYAASWFAGVILAFIMYMFSWLCKQQQENLPITRFRLSPVNVCTILSLLLLIVTPLENLTNKNLGTETEYEYFYGVEDCSRMLRSFADQSDKVYLVCNDTDGFSYYLFKDAISPLTAQSGNWDIFSSKEEYNAYLEKYSPTSNNASFLSINEWNKMLFNEYDYVFILHPNEFFSSMYGGLFEDPKTIDNGTFYRVVKQANGTVLLSYIGSIGINWYK